jgi:intracellular septation protein A
MQGSGSQSDALRALQAARQEASSGETFNPLIFRSAYPILVYWVVRQVATTQLAILAGFAMAVYVFASNRQRSGVVATLALLGMVIVGGSAIVGLILDSDKAYLASDAGRDFLMTTIALGSLIVGRPLVGVVTREVFPRLGRVLDEDHRVFIYLTLGFALLNLLTGGIRIVLLQELSITQYIVFSRVVTFPINMAFFVFGAVLVYKSAQTEAATRFFRRDPDPPAPPSGQHPVL